jgi:hypothetical protein
LEARQETLQLDSSAVTIYRQIFELLIAEGPITRRTVKNLVQLMPRIHKVMLAWAPFRVVYGWLCSSLKIWPFLAHALSHSHSLLKETEEELSTKIRGMIALDIDKIVETLVLLDSNFAR